MYLVFYTCILFFSKYKIDKLRPISYYNILHNKKDIGFIAHEVQEIFPELVTGIKDGENLQSLNYTGLIGILTKEIQDLKQENKQIKDELKQIKELLKK